MCVLALFALVCAAAAARAAYGPIPATHYAEYLTFHVQQQKVLPAEAFCAHSLFASEEALYLVAYLSVSPSLDDTFLLKYGIEDGQKIGRAPVNKAARGGTFMHKKNGEKKIFFSMNFFEKCFCFFFKKKITFFGLKKCVIQC